MSGERERGREMERGQSRAAVGGGERGRSRGER